MAKTITKMVKKEDHTAAYAMWGVLVLLLLVMAGKFLGWW